MERIYWMINNTLVDATILSMKVGSVSSVDRHEETLAMKRIHLTGESGNRFLGEKWAIMDRRNIAEWI
jgi:hypothetical protein